MNSTVTSAHTATADGAELHNGDRMNQLEFHRIYTRMPSAFKAELIGGTVYVASPLKLRHGTHHLPLGSLLFWYESRTPGTQCGDNTTILLGEESEPQPDLFLRILPEFGGQSKTTDDDYVQGAPELVAEIAFTSYAIDLHAKLDDYAKHGVQEYLVVNLREQRLHWFDLASGSRHQPDSDGVVRPRTFPGLWIHAESLLAKDSRRMMATLEQGLASSEYIDFRRRLAHAGPAC